MNLKIFSILKNPLFHVNEFMFSSIIVFNQTIESESINCESFKRALGNIFYLREKFLTLQLDRWAN